MNGLTDFINQNYIQGIINDTSYNHIDMITYILVLFAGVYAVLKLLHKWKIKVDENFVISTIPYIFMGSVFRVIEDANLLNPPIKYLFITPVIYFVVFGICSGILLLTRHLQSIKKIKDFTRLYAACGILISIAGIMILLLYSHSSLRMDELFYNLIPAVVLTVAVAKISPALRMNYLQNRVYSFAIFSFVLDSFTTYIGVDLMGYTNKHPFSSFLTSIFGTGIILIPLSLILVVLIILMLERESKNDVDQDEKYMLALTLIVLGFSMGARNLLAMTFGV